MKDYRGELLIVASKKPEITVRQYEDPLKEWFRPGPLPTGEALCIAKLVDCRRMRTSDEAAALCECYQGAYAWVLEDIRPIEPFPVRGQMGLYDVEVEK